MPRFKIVNSHFEELGYNSKWIDSTHFNSLNRIVDKKGKTPNPNYAGERYRIILKKERAFSFVERTQRGLLGTSATVCSLGLSLFSKPIRSLFTKQKKMTRFAIPLSSKDFNWSEKKLQQGLTIPEDALIKIEIYIETILQKKEENGFQFYHSQETHRVFEMDIAPGLIFKMDYFDSIKDHYQNMLYAQIVVHTHQLGLLVIPKAKLLTIKIEDKKYKIIAQEKMLINQHEGAQEQYCLEHADSLNETIRQLATFICKTGYSDVVWINNPILNNSLDENGNRKIALIDLEEMQDPEIGLFGNKQRIGLVKSINEEQGKIVETIAKENGLCISSFENVYSKRIEELEERRKLKEYYVKKGIIKGNEPVQVDETILSFSTDPETEKTLKDLTFFLIKGINDVILQDSSEESVKERRSIYINTRDKLLLRMKNTLVDPHQALFTTEEEYHEATFLGCIVKKLQDLGAIYKLNKRNGLGYYIQA